MYNENVGTWIGIIGTFLFLIISAEAGGFRGAITGYFFFMICYLAVMWLTNSFAIHHRWARYVITYLALTALILSSLAILYFAWKGVYISSLFVFLILNIGVFLFARRKKVVA
jgi:hypothetical protein